VSFFDEDDEPRRRPRPRRPTGGVAVDPQTLRVRQGVLAGVGLLVVILLALGVRGCLGSAERRGLRDYTDDVSRLMQRSDRETVRPFFERLAGGGAGGQLDLEAQVNQQRDVAQQVVADAQGLEAPDEMRPAQSALVLVLEMRRDALRQIGAKLPTAQATGDAADEAIVQLTGQIQLFYASQILYKWRVAPLMEQALADSGVEDANVPETNSFSTIQWLQADRVARALNTTLSASRRGGPVAPGSHGHGLTSVTVAGTTLEPGTANRIAAGSNLAFTVRFQNQGENDETGVVVRVSIEGSGEPVTAQATVPQTSQGSEASVDVPLSDAPPIGRPVEVKVTVEAVPGEEMTDNNEQTFPVLFTQG
jgi:hypothetical protein